MLNFKNDYCKHILTWWLNNLCVLRQHTYLIIVLFSCEDIYCNHSCTYNISEYNSYSRYFHNTTCPWNFKSIKLKIKCCYLISSQQSLLISCVKCPCFLTFAPLIFCYGITSKYSNLYKRLPLDKLASNYICVNCECEEELCLSVSHFAVQFLWNHDAQELYHQTNQKIKTKCGNAIQFILISLLFHIHS